MTKALKGEENDANLEASDECVNDESPLLGSAKKNTENVQEDNINSHDGMDIDMTDIVVIDEYDSTKADAKSDETLIKVKHHSTHLNMHKLICKN